MRRLALANDSMNRLHCPEHSLVYAEVEIAWVQSTLKIKQMAATNRKCYAKVYMANSRYMDGIR
jgi:hypothetical protein